MVSYLLTEDASDEACDCCEAFAGDPKSWKSLVKTKYATS